MSNKHFHIKSSGKFEVKELFKDTSKIIKSHFRNRRDKIDLLDIGCAAGELLYFLKHDLKTAGEIYGIDISKELIKNARERFSDSGINFVVEDARNFKLGKKFDVITASSIISYFDDPYPILKNFLRHLKKNGLLIISGLFNDWNIDVRLQYKLSNDKRWRDDAVLNQFSVKNIEDFFNKQGYKCKITTQVMPFDIPSKDHPIRSWTVNLNGDRYMRNGLQLVYNIKILKITKK